ncbi:MAG: hypothetical protein K8S25_12915 [Alphaproteobacteria bacterium]|nr:hypothetical protein [Alphaproteobacteria bacterium]
MMFCSSAVLAAPAADGNDTSVGAVSDLQLIYLSAQLATTARAQRDALGMIQAARCLMQVEAYPVAMTHEVEGGAADGDGVVSPTRVDTVASLLAEARGFAGADGLILALITRLEKAPDPTAPIITRGSPLGPKYHKRLVARFAHVTYRADFRANELAEVTLRGAGVANLDLVVMDDKRNVLCESRNSGDVEYCSWQPKANGQFLLVVENRGPQTDLYSIFTN